MGLHDDILTEPVSQLQLRQVVSMPPTAKVRDAVAMMRGRHIGCVIVIDADKRPIGKFTEKMLVKLLLEQDGWLEQPLSEVMEPEFAAVRLDDPIAGVLAQLARGDHRFVVVLDAQGRALGLTGQKGVIEYVADHFPRQVKVQLMESRLFMEEREGA